MQAHTQNIQRCNTLNYVYRGGGCVMGWVKEKCPCDTPHNRTINFLHNITHAVTTLQTQIMVRINMSQIIFVTDNSLSLDKMVQMWYTYSYGKEQM